MNTNAMPTVKKLIDRLNNCRNTGLVNPHQLKDLAYFAESLIKKSKEDEPRIEFCKNQLGSYSSWSLIKGDKTQPLNGLGLSDNEFETAMKELEQIHGKMKQHDPFDAGFITCTVYSFEL